jgi:hypothetical protein
VEKKNQEKIKEKLTDPCLTASNSAGVKEVQEMLFSRQEIPRALVMLIQVVQILHFEQNIDALIGHQWREK